MAEAIANSLLLDNNEKKTYDLTAGEAYSFTEIAGALSELSGKTVFYTSPDADSFKQQLKEAGVPEIGILIAAGFASDIRNGQYDIVYKDLENLLGRKPTALKPALQAFYNLQSIIH